MERRVMSRDVQVRVVFCDWLAWLLHMKSTEHDVILKSVIDVHQTEYRNKELVTCDSAEDGSSIHDRRFTCSEVYAAKLDLSIML